MKKIKHGKAFYLCINCSKVVFAAMYRKRIAYLFTTCLGKDLNIIQSRVFFSFV